MDVDRDSLLDVLAVSSVETEGKCGGMTQMLLTLTGEPTNCPSLIYTELKSEELRTESKAGRSWKFKIGGDRANDSELLIQTEAVEGSAMGKVPYLNAYTSEVVWNQL